jgi:drug/metabolite transporter (DMT)-like permease
MSSTTGKKSFSGVSFAIIAALLFGASTPFSKLLLGKLEPVLMAALLYLGSGSGLALWRLLKKLSNGDGIKEAKLRRNDLPWLAAAIFAGGVVGPILLMFGLAITPASSASLLLNLEGVFTALLAWFVFKENFDRRIATGMAAITAGSLLLSWAGKPELGVPWGSIAIAGACIAWGIDNNLTRKVSAGDPVQIAATKGFAAGVVNLTIAFFIGAHTPAIFTALTAAFVGFLGYGVSLTMFVLALRNIGTARTGAYFSLAPFIGATVSILIVGDKPTGYFFGAALLMGIGVWLHLTEHHEHKHSHEEMAHEHRHVHDEHHQHEHNPSIPLKEPHSHWHVHKPMQHSHPHYPDIHHRHEHKTTVND